MCPVEVKISYYFQARLIIAHRCDIRSFNNIIISQCGNHNDAKYIFMSIHFSNSFSRGYYYTVIVTTIHIIYTYIYTTYIYIHIKCEHAEHLISRQHEATWDLWPQIFNLLYQKHHQSFFFSRCLSRNKATNLFLKTNPVSRQETVITLQQPHMHSQETWKR